MTHPLGTPQAPTRLNGSKSWNSLARLVFWFTASEQPHLLALKPGRLGQSHSFPEPPMAPFFPKPRRLSLAGHIQFFGP